MHSSYKFLKLALRSGIFLTLLILTGVPENQEHRKHHRFFWRCLFVETHQKNANAEEVTTHIDTYTCIYTLYLSY